MSNTDLNFLDGIEKFARDLEIDFPWEACEIKQSSYGGLGIFAREKLETGTCILRVHKSGVFSGSNCIIANLLADSEIDGMVALVIAFAYETTVFRNTSHWWPYLKSIAVDHSTAKKLLVPCCFWDPALQKLLRDTSLDTLFHIFGMASEIGDGLDLATDLAVKWNAEAMIPIPHVFSSSVPRTDRLKLFGSMALAVSSRAFEIDQFHESALVVIADLFNHCSGDHDLKFLSCYEVCDQCGSAGVCGHITIDEEGSSDSSDDEQLNGSEAENVDYDDEYARCNNGAPDMVLSKKEVTETPGKIDNTLLEALEKQWQMDLDEHVLSESHKEDDFIEMELIKTIQPGQEIFNSYGDYPNGILLARYGFCEANNPFDVVHLVKEMEYHTNQDPQLDKRLHWWKKKGYGQFQRGELECGNITEDDLTESITDTIICTSQGPSRPFAALLNVLTASEKSYKDDIDVVLRKESRDLLRNLCSNKLKKLEMLGKSLQDLPEVPRAIESWLLSEKRILGNRKRHWDEQGHETYEPKNSKALLV